MTSPPTTNRFIQSFLYVILYLPLITCESPQDYDGGDTRFRVLNPFLSNREINNSAVQVLDVIRELQPRNIIRANGRSYLDRAIRYDAVNNSQCQDQFALYVNGLEKFETWALKMLDSSSKIPSGILKGNLKDLGAYDECTSVEVKKELELIRGRPCMYSFSIDGTPMMPTSLEISLSICAPASCDAEDVTAMLKNLINETSANIPLKIRVGQVQCSVIDPAPFETGETVVLVILSIFLCFLIGCTICDIYARMTCRSRQNSFCNAISKFSFYTNIIRIFNTNQPGDNVSVVNGIRFFSLSWVILGHEYLLSIQGPSINPFDAREWYQSWSSTYILIAPYAVDTFFVLSGFLTSYLFMKEMSKGRRFNLITYYLHRYIRLTPAFAAIIILSIYLLPRMGSGAKWDSWMNNQKELCKQSWWPMMLYVHNYVGEHRLYCLAHTWYLAIDMQLFWISPIILLALAKKPKIGLSILSILLIISIITPAIVVGEEKYSASLTANISKPNRLMDMMYNLYLATHTRAGPWLLGIYLGYLITRRRHEINTKFMVLGWILALVAFSFIFFTHKIFQNSNYEWNAPWEIFYAGFARHIWAVGVCWLIYSSMMGYGGVIADLLSLRVFIPFGRISYCVYLIHMIIQNMGIASARVPRYFDQLVVTESFFGRLITSIIAGLALSLVFESPFLALEKIVFRRDRRDKTESREVLQDTEPEIGVNNDGYIPDKLEAIDGKV
ncbi:nose resistant to fluoxetine protein 6 [Fopius arisanus]|uniref:Nose resistant to fluoxetine protein 6 n=2 Tax=Fopius arisanus TaxID=64838 RepID=A0A9R1U037_9HYME|nr:PREDICTED: nose resistant to fluoxetine protein 6-like [Fopius arisanus]